MTAFPFAPGSAERAAQIICPENGWRPLPHQRAPKGEWDGWLLRAGRGAGKTDACAEATDRHVNGPPCDPRVPGGHRVGLIAPTLGDAAQSCVLGPSGLKAHNPGVKLVGGIGGTQVVWPGGAVGLLYGTNTTNDVERLRAQTNRCWDWFEELAAMRYLSDAVAQADFGRRLGPHPRYVGSSTPKNRPEFKAFMERDNLVITHATLYDNPHLPESTRRALQKRYEGTRLGKQELLGELVGDVGTLFQSLWLQVISTEEAAELFPLERCVTARCWDLAGTEPDPDSNPDPDYTAGVRVSRLAHDPDDRWLIRHVTRFRVNPGLVEQNTVTLARQDGKGTRFVLLKDPGQAGKAQVEHYRQALTGVAPFHTEPQVADKETRAQPVAAAAAQGRMWVVRSELWNPDLFDELDSFDGTGATHDDQLDALAGAYNHLEAYGQRMRMTPPRGQLRGVRSSPLPRTRIGSGIPPDMRRQLR